MRLPGHQTVFVDKLVGQLTGKLKAEGLYRRSTLVITSDHSPRRFGLGQKYAGIHHIENRFPNELNSIFTGRLSAYRPDAFRTSTSTKPEGRLSIRVYPPKQRKIIPCVPKFSDRDQENHLHLR
jgi:hypothetical protein